MVSRLTTKVGATVNSYQVITKLAAGGMAEIFLARSITSTGVERYCALKRMLPERAGDQRFAQMFFDEARLALLLQHPNIASGYDIGTLEDLYFYTMEYVHGATVRSLLERTHELHRPIPLACVLTIAAGAAAGLHHAHERCANDGRPLGIVHRDVSPSNLMVSYEGNVKVIDFGVAKAADRKIQTAVGTVKGKITYLSPEQCRGERVDRRSDLFSLGIVMWEMLTGSRLYQRATALESMRAIVDEDPPPPSSRRYEIPREVDAIVLRLLGKSVADRFQTAAEVVEAIEHALVTLGTTLSAAAVGRLVHDVLGPRTEPWRELEHEQSAAEVTTQTARPMVLRLDSPGVRAEDRESDDELTPSASRSLTDSTRVHVAALPDALATPASVASPGAGVVTLSVEVSGSVSRLLPDLPPEASPPQTRPDAEVPSPAPVCEPPAAPRDPLIAPQSSPAAPPMKAGAGPAYSEAPHHRPAAAAAAPRLAIAAAVVAIIVAVAVALGNGQSRVLPVLQAEPSQVTGSDGQGGDHTETPPQSPLHAGAADHGVAVVPVEVAASPPPDRVAAPPASPRTGAPQPTASRERRGQETISVKIDSEPAGAQVVLDGRVLGTTPLRGALPRGDHDLELVIQSPGYIPHVAVVGSSRSISEHVVLVRRATRWSPAERDRIVNPF